MERATPTRTAHGPPALIKLPRSFYIRPTLSVARDLPGKFLVRKLGGSLLIGRIVEVEAYLGSLDPASHAYRGMTPRNEIMFREGGCLYVYFTYGMHFCCNVVTGPQGRGHAVLIRALEPIDGIDVMTKLRSGTGKRAAPERDLCRGPARLCKALGIARPENGTDLCGNTIWLARGAAAGSPVKIARSKRIGISSGREHLWRFHIRNSAYVSRGASTKAGE